MESHHVEIRHLTFEDMSDLKSASERVYDGGAVSVWTSAILHRLSTVFPEGQIVAFVDGKAVGLASSLIISFANFGGELICA